MLRMPVVAYRFYPGDPAELRDTLANLVPLVAQERKKDALAIILPHAGYIYSGGVAGQTVAQVNIPETMVILGPNHHGRGKPLALGLDDWSMPLGRVSVARDLAEKILEKSSLIVHDETAHLPEHSLEVQVPFLQHVRKDFRIVPVVVSHLSFAQCQQAAQDLAAAIKAYQKPVLLVASTDMTHYESRQSASPKDRLALDRITALDPRGLYKTVTEKRISMCGIMPTTIVVQTALELGASQAELIRYTDSGEASGDTNEVVGYAGLVIS